MATLKMPISDQIEAVIAEVMSANPNLCFAVGCATSPDISPNIYYFPSPSSKQAQKHQAENAASPTESTLWMLASVTKTFTATAYALQLRNQATSTISEYVQLPYNVSTMQIETLVNYQSGLPSDNQNNPDIDAGQPQNPYCIPTMIDYLNGGTIQLSNSPVKSPNDQGWGYTYSNLAFALMGYVLSVQNNDTFQNVMVNQVFNPLGMSCVFLNDGTETKIACGFDYPSTKENPYSPTIFQSVVLNNPLFPSYYPAGGLISTAPDMMTWLTFNMGWFIQSNNDQLRNLSQALASTQELNGGVTTGPAVNPTYPQLGWFTTFYEGENKSPPITYKDGELSGARSYIAFYTNLDPGNSATQGGAFVLANARGLQYVDTMEKSHDLVEWLTFYLLRVMRGEAG